MTPEREEELLERLVIAIEQLADNIEGVRLQMDKKAGLPNGLVELLMDQEIGFKR